MEVQLFGTTKKRKEKKNCIDAYTAIWGGLIHCVVFFFNYFSVGNPPKKKNKVGLVIILTPKLVSQQVGLFRKTMIFSPRGRKKRHPNKLVGPRGVKTPFREST